jgi:thioredoxin reductase (NADPH)
MSEYLIKEVARTPNIRVRLGTEVIAGEGNGHLESVTVLHRSSGDVRRLPTSGLFVMIGGTPRTGWLQGSLALDAEGYILTGAGVPRDGEGPTAWTGGRAPHHLETSVPGVLAAGDAREGSVKRVASAVGEGTIAVQLLHQILEEAVGPALGADRYPARVSVDRGAGSA